MNMTKPTSASRTVEMTLRLPIGQAQAVAKAAAALSMTKTDFLRKSVSRNLQFVAKNEIPLIESNTRIKEALAVDSTEGVA